MGPFRRWSEPLGRTDCPSLGDRPISPKGSIVRRLAARTSCMRLLEFATERAKDASSGAARRPRLAMRVERGDLGKRGLST
jgi:hypothetical protein